MRTHQKNRKQDKEFAPQTRGRVITQARFYDPLVKLVSLGKDRALRQLTMELARLQPGETVLDVGCGTGTLTMLARERVGETGRMYGIDAAPQMIAVARQKAARRNLAIDFQVGLIEQLPFPDDTFDVALSSLMMHHLPDDLKRQGLAEIARVLKPGGRLLILDINRAQSGRGGEHAHQSGRHASLRDLPALLLHVGKLERYMQDLPTLMQAAGFSQIESGETRWRVLGFVLGRIDK